MPPKTIRGCDAHRHDPVADADSIGNWFRSRRAVSRTVDRLSRALIHQMLGRSGFGFSGAMASHTGIGSDGLGLRGNFSIWEADSLEALHETLTSLPLHPYMDIEIYPLIKHTTTVAWEAENGEMPPFWSDNLWGRNGAPGNGSE